MVCMLDEMAWYPLQESKAILKKIFKQLAMFSKISFLFTTSALLSVERYFSYQMKGIDALL